MVHWRLVSILVQPRVQYHQVSGLNNRVWAARAICCATMRAPTNLILIKWWRELGYLLAYYMISYIFHLFRFSPRGLPKVMIEITPAHMGACPLGLLPYFTSLNWSLLFWYPPFGWGCKLSWLCPCLWLLDQYLWGTRSSIDGKPEFRLAFLEQQSDKEIL